MFVTLFIETNADDLLTEEQGKQRHARQARRSRSAPSAGSLPQPGSPATTLMDEPPGGPPPPGGPSSLRPVRRSHCLSAGRGW